MKKDYSIEIYNKYYKSKNRILEIRLKDNTILHGVFVGVFHGDPQIGEPYVIKWHFLFEEDIEQYHSPAPAGIKKIFGRIIKQEDIRSIKFIV